jgi:hypothetical protein
MAESPISRHSFTPDEPSPWTPWVAGFLAAIAILGIALGMMKLAGLLDIPTNDTGAKTLAAALALVGTVFSAAVTLVGTVVKYSIDDGLLGWPSLRQVETTRWRRTLREETGSTRLSAP